jgi:hypothetical protein
MPFAYSKTESQTRLDLHYWSANTDAILRLRQRIFAGSQRIVCIKALVAKEAVETPTIIIVPDWVMIFRKPPEARPNCAIPPDVITSNSRITSWL